MTPQPQEWETRFDEMIYGWHGKPTEIVHEDEFFYSIEKIKAFIAAEIDQARQAGRDEAVEYIEKNADIQIGVASHVMDAARTASESDTN